MSWPNLTITRKGREKGERKGEETEKEKEKEKGERKKNPTNWQRKISGLFSYKRQTVVLSLKSMYPTSELCVLREVCRDSWLAGKCGILPLLSNLEPTLNLSVFAF